MLFIFYTILEFDLNIRSNSLCHLKLCSIESEAILEFFHVFRLNFWSDVVLMWTMIYMNSNTSLEMFISLDAFLCTESLCLCPGWSSPT